MVGPVCNSSKQVEARSVPELGRGVTLPGADCRGAGMRRDGQGSVFKHDQCPSLRGTLYWMMSRDPLVIRKACPAWSASKETQEKCGSLTDAITGKEKDLRRDSS